MWYGATYIILQAQTRWDSCKCVYETFLAQLSAEFPALLLQGGANTYPPYFLQTNAKAFTYKISQSLFEGIFSLVRFGSTR